MSKTLSSRLTDTCFERFPTNPILRPQDVIPSVDGAIVECLLNPGAFRLNDETCLLLRVAERMEQEVGWLSTLVADEQAAGGIRVVRFRRDDPKLDYTDPRVFAYDGVSYLTTLSHLRLARSRDGRTFTVDPKPLLIGEGSNETYGIEDCRVTRIDGVDHLTYSAVSISGVGVGLRTTQDWQTFVHHGMVLPPHNKDCTLFEERIAGNYACLHRPVGADIGGPYIWYGTSPDLEHWGHHRCVARTRAGYWDSQRIGAGAAPIRTKAGWLEIYHGADDESRYCLGALLLDLNEPWKVLARSEQPLMEPLADYEREGFFGKVVFTNGHIVDGDRLTMYYGASDTVICGATASISDILGTLSH